MLVSKAFTDCTQEALLYGGADKTRKNYVTALNSFIECVGDKDIDSITMQDCITWTQHMTDKGKSSATIHTNICRLRQVLRYAEERGITVMNYHKIKTPKVIVKPIRPLHPRDIAWIIGLTNNLRDQLLLSFLFSTCCRITEALSINRKDIDGDKVVVVGKGFKFRPVYIDDRTLELLERYLAVRTDDGPALFVTADGRRLSYAMASVVVTETAKKAGMGQRVTAHLYRHSGATSLMENGMHMRAIQKYLGHEHITTTERYTHVSDKFMRDQFKVHHKV